ncbi:cobalamin-binding protein [Methanosarcina sp. KYL-1]|uniref:cobalamin B12-binding domain-containing protein n=1 Tax=Methanosarcina sp. KYL-1 TaxID=2602068 RepID=UPI002100D587|nr:cobalamin-dependent protein [Methanosarcina sp. KYL-1]MCQ1536844.1 cobalamin-binding protein [Methanosarcina sp. KYL-1]
MVSYEKHTENFESALLSIDRIAARKLIGGEVKFSSPFEIIEKIIAPALERIGSKWESGEIALAQNYMACKISEEIVESILPAEAPERARNPKIGVATLGDHHLLGKRMVISFLRSLGFKVVDFGTDEPAVLIKKLDEEEIDILLVSILMLNLTLKVKELRALIDSRKLKTKIIAGGAPFQLDPQLYLEIGADAMAINSSDIVKHINGWRCASLPAEEKFL